LLSGNNGYANLANSILPAIPLSGIKKPVRNYLFEKCFLAVPAKYSLEG
jgi:hypothetical protein